MHVFPGVWFSSSYVSPVLLDLLFSRMYITPVCMVLKDVRFYRMHTFQNVWFSRSYGFPAELLVGSSPSATQLLDKPLKIVPLRKPKLESNHLPHAITHSILLVSAAQHPPLPSILPPHTHTSNPPLNFSPFNPFHYSWILHLCINSSSFQSYPCLF